MIGRGTLFLLLTTVAGAAAMLSFAALRDLALLCGFGPRLAWLLPVVVDAGAGRRRLSRELGVTEHEARRLLAQARPTTTETESGDTPSPDRARETTAVAPTTDPTTTGPTAAGVLS